jgi:hypothetical protein
LAGTISGFPFYLYGDKKPHTKKMKTSKGRLKPILSIILIICCLGITAGSPNFRKGKGSFSANKPVSAQVVAINYADLKNWAAHPGMHDPADSIPSFLKDEKRDTGVDVFFMHPRWTMPL